MACLESFSFFVSGNQTFSDPQLEWWGAVNVNTWVVNNFGTSNSTFNVQGFKNINVYGIDMIGYLDASHDNNRSALISDWGFSLLIDGQVPEISGNITASPNFYGMTTAYPSIQKATLTKMKTNISFANPITSVRDITIEGLYANGTNLQTVGVIQLIWSATFVVYYKYEGEN